MKNLLVILILAVFSSSCTHALHVYHVADYKGGPKKGHVIKAEGLQKVILGFVYDTDYVDEAISSLESSCSGRISNINTRYSTSHSFFSWTNKVKMTALCLD